MLKFEFPVLLASIGLAMATDAIILGLTIAKTIRISVDAHKLGIKAPVSSLILRDGNFFADLLSTWLTRSYSRNFLFHVRCVGRCGDGMLISFNIRALTLLSIANLVAIKVKLKFY